MDMVNQTRQKELALIRQYKLVNAGNSLAFQGLPKLMPLATFGVYVLCGHELNPGLVFSSLAVIDLVQGPINMLSQAVQSFVQIRVSIDRIQRILLAKELQEFSPRHPRDPAMPAYVWSVGEDDIGEKDLPLERSISVDSTNSRAVVTNQIITPVKIISAAFCWGTSLERQISGAESILSRSTPSLTVDSLELPAGKLTLVIGAVGAGKSTLVAALLNEIQLASGQVHICGKVGYCAQTPWIMHGNVVDNILLGEELDDARFAEITRACALSADFKELRDGAETMIGDRGVNLSGGQKARVGLARAAYRYPSTSIYILDDPLAAVDVHVAAHLMEECLGSEHGILKESTRILVTHQLQYIDKADFVVVIRDGIVVAARAPMEFTADQMQALGCQVSEAPLVREVPVEVMEDQPALQNPEGVKGKGKGKSKEDCQVGDEEPLQAPPTFQRQRTTEVEDQQIGHITLRVWCTYAKATGGLTAIAFLVSYLATNMLQLGSALWLAYWSGLSQATTAQTVSNLLIYGALSSGLVLLISLRQVLFCRTSVKVSQEKHQEALWAVLRSPMSWFDRNPTGRILNRFGSDMQKVDMDLQGSSSDFVDSVVSSMFSLGLMISKVPLLLIMVAPMGYVFNLIQRSFRTTMREVQRLISASKSPMFQALDEAIAGITTMRAFRCQQHFISLFWRKVGLATRLEFSMMGLNQWLNLRLKGISVIPAAGLALFLVLEVHVDWLNHGLAISGALAGLTLRYALQLASDVAGVLQQLTSLELSLIALERVTAYTHLELEDSLVLENGNLTEAGDALWPSSGEIEFQEVSMRYRADLPEVLRSVSFTVKGGTSLGVIGRTGAGKSSLLQCLFRICPLAGGSVLVDGVDIENLGLHTLRKRLAIIPQDPVGFTGTLRFNLDPFEEISTDAIWAGLEKVQLAGFVRSQTAGLNHLLAAGGENLSVGQRQLLCAARAFLRGSRILALDEATASVDFKTDALIQEVLCNEVAKNKMTTLTIAHRIATIINNDNVLILDHGRVVEFGPPQKLGADPSSIFSTFLPES